MIDGDEVDTFAAIVALGCFKGRLAGTGIAVDVEVDVIVHYAIFGDGNA